MTIRDVEWETGLERTNIRFYERAGLITPVKLENGYRQYSYADIALLKKIKLLRKLGFSLDDIRSLKDGSAELEEAVSIRLARITGQRSELNAIEIVCHQMRNDKAVFSTLNADHYLNSYERALSSPVEINYSVPESDRLLPVFCPWRRYFARYFDYFWVSAIVNILLALVFGINISAIPWFWSWLLGIGKYLVLVVFEGALISCFTTTPGKWLMNIRIEHTYGRRLTFGEAALRAFRVFTNGEGLTIPIFGLYRNWKSYKRHKKGEELPWDEDAVITVKDQKWWSVPLYLVLIAVIVVIVFFAAISPATPKNRGPELTVEQFAENYNQMRKYLGQGGLKLESNGIFESTEKYYNSGQFSTSLDDHLEIQYKLEDGIVTGFSISEDTNVRFLSIVDSEWSTVIQVATMAYSWSGARPLEALRAPNVLNELSGVVANAYGEVDWHLKLFDTMVNYTITELEGEKSVTGDPVYRLEFSIDRLNLQ